MSQIDDLTILKSHCHIAFSITTRMIGRIYSVFCGVDYVGLLRPINMWQLPICIYFDWLVYGGLIIRLSFKNLTLSNGVVSVCLSCCLFGVKTGQNFLVASTVTLIILNGQYGASFGPCERILKNLHFLPLFCPKMAPFFAKMDLFHKGMGDFFSGSMFSHVCGG